MRHAGPVDDVRVVIAGKEPNAGRRYRRIAGADGGYRAVRRPRRVAPERAAECPLKRRGVQGVHALYVVPTLRQRTAGANVKPVIGEPRPAPNLDLRVRIPTAQICPYGFFAP